MEGESVVYHVAHRGWWCVIPRQHHWPALRCGVNSGGSFGRYAFLAVKTHNGDWCHRKPAVGRAADCRASSLGHWDGTRITPQRRPVVLASY